MSVGVASMSTAEFSDFDIWDCPQPHIMSDSNVCLTTWAHVRCHTAALSPAARGRRRASGATTATAWRCRATADSRLRAESAVGRRRALSTRRRCSAAHLRRRRPAAHVSASSSTRHRPGPRSAAFAARTSSRPNRRERNSRLHVEVEGGASACATGRATRRGRRATIKQAGGACTTAWRWCRGGAAICCRRQGWSSAVADRAAMGHIRSTRPPLPRGGQPATRRRAAARGVAV